MKKNCLRTYPERWLVAGILALAILTLAFQGGDGKVDPAHCYTCPSRTPTRTPTATLTPTSTSTPTRTLQACQVVAVEFDRANYLTGDPIKVTVRLADASGAPLIGANIDATVDRQPFTNTLEASAIPPLEDQSGTYDGVYTQTELPGTYTFKFNVSDFTGPRFLPCSAERTVRVNLSPTVTPTVTFTPTPTVTVTPAPGSGIIIDLPAQPIDLCGRGPDISGTIAVSNVTNLTAVQLEVSYDPTFIQVIDAFGRPRPPVQVKPDPNFDPFLSNQVDTGQGKIFFAANARTPFTGRGNVISVDWRLQGRTGTTSITVLATLTDVSGTRSVTQVASLTITIGPPCSTGLTSLQGRTNHSGVIVTNAAGQQSQSYPNGLFAISPQGPLSFTFPGYLSAQADLAPGAAEPSDSLGNFTLLAGDVNGDHSINILDLVYLAQRYQSADPTADLNADGAVNILDLVLVAGNYQRQGPLTIWK